MLKVAVEVGVEGNVELGSVDGNVERGSVEGNDIDFRK